MKRYSIITAILLLVTFVFLSSGCFGGDGDSDETSGNGSTEKTESVESVESGVSESVDGGETNETGNSGITKTEYTVKFESDGETIYETRVKSGETLESPEAPTKNHYFIDGWYKGGEKWNFEMDKVSSDITLVAKWSPEVYTVTFVSEVGEKVEKQTITYDPVNGKAVKPKIKEFVKTSAYEYEFIGWYSGDTKWNFDNIVEKNIELVARWNKNTAIGVLPSD